MKNSIVIIGQGEMGGVFARGFLRTGHPVVPITRDTDITALAETLPTPELVLIAVGEKDLQENLARLPDPWRTRVALLQNELLPADWAAHGYSNPTIISVWFEKKKGQDAKVLIPSPVHGPHAALLRDALASIDIPARIVDSDDDMLFELVRKNVYILTTNIVGLETGGNVSALWRNHQSLARDVAGEIIRLQEKLTGRTLDSEALTQGMLEAFDGDPQHNCMGRSAPARLQRALALADEHGLQLPTLQGLARHIS